MAGVGFGMSLGAIAGPIGRLVESASVTSPRVEKFEVPLPVPPVLKLVRTEGTTDYYEITQREETVEILPGYKTTV